MGLPTEKEFAKLIIGCADSGAMQGLQVFGWKRTENSVVEAIDVLRSILNNELPESVKAMFHNGDVGVFDIEHLLCKVARKRKTRNPSFLGPKGNSVPLKCTTKSESDIKAR